MSKPRIYLDNNATTRPLPEVVEAVARCYRDCYANPGSQHADGRVARRALEESRESIAAIVGAKPEQLVFTSGGTESINLALFGFTARQKPATIALTAGEHPATMEPCKRLKREGWKLHTLEVDSDGRLRDDQFDSLPWEELRLVTLILAHNETGVIQDIAPLAKLCRTNGVPLHVDGVQAVGKIAVDFAKLDVAALSFGAHKFHGPRGIGALLVRERKALSPRTFGGHQESGLRPGTEPVALAVGMAKALELWNTDRENRTRRTSELRDRLEATLLEKCEPAVVNGSRDHRLPNTLSIAFPGLDGEALLVNLDLAGVACSLGSACASGSVEPAPVLVSMGCAPEIYRSSVRFSLSFENTEREIDDAADRIASVVSRLREVSAAKV